MFKVLITESVSEKCTEILTREKEISVDIKLKLTPEQLKDQIKGYDAVIVRSSTKITKDIIHAADRLKVVGRAGVGLDNVDVEAASEKGIIVMNSPSGNTISTAEHTMSMMLSLARSIPQANVSLRAGKWDRKSFVGVELYGKTMGVIGLGRIGYAVAKRCLSFGMTVFAYDPFLSPERAKDFEVTLVSFDQIIKEADFITVHTPLTEETKYLLNKEAFKKMKKGVRIINCARGGIVEEKALYAAIQEGHVAGAALDVFEEEPPSDTALIMSDKVITTPHLGASTEEAQVNVAVDIAQQVADALLGRGIRNAANIPSIDPESFRFIEPYIRLAEYMGMFGSQIVEGAMVEMEVDFLGDISKYEVSPVSTAAIKGALSVFLRDSVNYINAGVIAKQRGIKVVTKRISESDEYTNAVMLTLKTDKSKVVITGTLYTKKDPRIVRIDSFYIDVALSQYMVYISNEDKPGIVGQVGSIMGNHKINIGGMYFGRETAGGRAITVLNVDSNVPDHVVTELKNARHVCDVKRIKL